MNPSPKTTISDEELILRYRDGESSAFPSLFSRYRGKVFLLVRGYFPNRERAEEVFQEIFLKVFERLDSFDASGSFRSWFLTLCRNHCIDRIRQQARRPEVPESGLRSAEDTLPSPLETTADGADGPDQAAYSRELAEGLKTALGKLPEEQRETFLLKERMGMTFEEIAELMEVSVNTAKSRMRYALEGLRRALKGKGFVKEAMR
jgi:RNA polymerase sigma-70 factor (ECF subfamily)